MLIILTLPSFGVVQDWSRRMSSILLLIYTLLIRNKATRSSESLAGCI